jgi:inorganic pyrophosphatase
MLLTKIEPFHSLPDDVNVVIEIAANSYAVKYEICKDTSLLNVDRFMPTAMHYPCDYGFIPNTLSEDGDPTDVLVLTPLPVQPGCVMRVRVVGMLTMEDESGLDNKLIALPIKKICTQYAHIESLDDISPVMLESIKHFFENYKGLEQGKWVKVGGYSGVEAAQKEIVDSVARYEAQK